MVDNMSAHEHLQACNKLLKKMEDGPNKAKVSKAQATLLEQKIQKLVKHVEINALLETGFAGFVTADADRLIAICVQRIEQAAASTTGERQEWNFRNLLPATIQGQLAANDGYELLNTFLLSAGLWTPSEPTYQLMSALLLLATGQERLSDDGKSVHLKAVKRWFTAAKKGRCPPERWIQKFPSSAEQFSLLYPALFEKLYSAELPSDCMFTIPQIELVCAGSWMRRHTGKANKDPIAAVAQAANATNVGQPPMQQMWTSCGPENVGQPPMQMQQMWTMMQQMMQFMQQNNGMPGFQMPPSGSAQPMLGTTPYSPQQAMLANFGGPLEQTPPKAMPPAASVSPMLPSASVSPKIQRLKTIMFSDSESQPHDAESQPDGLPNLDKLLSAEAAPSQSSSPLGKNLEKQQSAISTVSSPLIIDTPAASAWSSASDAPPLPSAKKPSVAEATTMVLKAIHERGEKRKDKAAAA